MSQGDILQFLKEQYELDPNKWFTSDDLIKGTGQTRGSVNNNCKRLMGHTERTSMICSKYVKREHGAWHYIHRHKPQKLDL